jgi:mono/diheme cytochrome c family protein
MLIIYSFNTLSCKDESTNNHTSNIVFPDSLISFNKYVQPLFQQTCVAGGCHGGSQPAANLNLEYNAWSGLIDYQPDIVLETKGYISPLVMYLDGRRSPQMPLKSKPLTQNQINGVTKWIDEGAQNN